MTLNELLEVIDDDARIRIQVKMFGCTFCTNRYRNTLLEDEEVAELLEKEVEMVGMTKVAGISTLVIALK